MPLVKDLMSESLAVVSPEDHLHDALTMMNRAGYRHLPVVMDDKLVGIITRDRPARTFGTARAPAHRPPPPLTRPSSMQRPI